MISPLFTRPANFYPRPPRGGRPKTAASSTNGNVFLSTPSARRATQRRQDGNRLRRISIHALRVEGDEELPPIVLVTRIFLSTPSARRATCLCC